MLRNDEQSPSLLRWALSY